LKSRQRKPEYSEKFVPFCQYFHDSPSTTRNLLGWNRNLIYEGPANLLPLNTTDLRILKYGHVSVRPTAYVRQIRGPKLFRNLGAISKIWAPDWWHATSSLQTTEFL